jgi:hypothetical protein
MLRDWRAEKTCLIHRRYQLSGALSTAAESLELPAGAFTYSTGDLEGTG